MSVTDSLDEQCDRFYDNHFMRSQQGFSYSNCKRFFKKSWLSVAAIGFLCVYTPIRAYALRNIWYYKEELQHEGGDVASDVTEEEDIANATNKQKNNQISAETHNE